MKPERVLSHSWVAIFACAACGDDTETNTTDPGPGRVVLCDPCATDLGLIS